MHSIGLAAGEELPGAVETQHACRLWGVRLWRVGQQQAELCQIKSETFPLRCQFGLGSGTAFVLREIGYPQVSALLLVKPIKPDRRGNCSGQ